MAVTPLSVIGKPENKDVRLIEKMTGAWEFSSDYLPGKKLFAHIARSTIARGKVLSIDTSAAEKLPGVKAVMTYKDYSWWSDTILWWGQEVAAVAAVDEETAQRAVDLIKVTYQEGSSIVDPEDGMKSGAPLSGIWPDSNVRTATLLRGDVDAGFKEAAVTVEDTINWVAPYSHNCLEPRTCVAWWVGNHVYLRTTTQNPFGQRSAVGGYTIMGEKIPFHRIHLISHGTGGGHGDKSAGDWIPVAIVLAKKSGMPVCYHESRVEYLTTGSHQIKYKSTIKLGAKSDGTLVAIDWQSWADATAAARAGAAGMHFPIRTTFKCATGRFKSTDIACNTPRAAAWRCVSDPPGDHVMNPILDQMAVKLGMDPVAFRLKNIVKDDSVSQDVVGADGKGLPYGGIAPAECCQKAADAIGWSSKVHAPGARTLPDGRKHGMAISGHIDSHGQLSSPVGYILNLTAQGKCLCNPGTGYASGSVNATTHIVAETLGMLWDDVTCAEIGNTDTASEGGGEGGSTRTITTGAAADMAARDARAQAFEIAAKMFTPALTPDKLSAKEGKIFETANPANSKTWAEVAARFRNPIVGRGYTWDKQYQRAKNGWPVGTPCETRSTCFTAIEVAVDEETGHVEVLNQTNAQDCGRAIAYRYAIKQIIGGMEIQQGEAILYEQVLEKSTGATLNTGHVDHKYPTSLDIHPDAMTPIIVESDDVAGPWGAHGIGEPVVSQIGAYSAAVYNATGKWVKDLPLTPWNVLKALGKA
jgi:CO/xanthine dehydrogenase Mo-binding subunit